MVTTYDWEEMNLNPAIWTREKESITDEEYRDFWNVVAKGVEGDCVRWNHFHAEGNINFKSLLYIPEEIPESYNFGKYTNEEGLKLYVRKVLISDSFDLLPDYLGFVKGVVDSDDLPLNVNRETLQESKITKVIKKKLVRKVLDTIRAFSKEPMPEDDEVSVELDEEGNIIDEEEQEEKVHPYIEWYSKFNNNIKMGIIDDEPNRGRLMKLLRFQTSKSDGKWTSLEDYVENMTEKQKEIYVIAGVDYEAVSASPFLDPFKEKDLEVLYLTDPVDEYMIQQLRDFEGKKFSSITSENVKIPEDDEDLAKRRAKVYKKKFKPLTKWLQKLYGPAVMRVMISKRLGNQASLVSNSEYGQSANTQRIMKAQAYQAGQNGMVNFVTKIMEINPRHPLVIKLLEGSPPEEEEEGAEPFVVSKEMEDVAWLLLDIASLNGGFDVFDVNAHATRVSKFLQSSLEIPTFDLEDEIDPPEEDDDAPDFDMDGMEGLNMGDFNMDDLDLDNLDLN